MYESKSATALWTAYVNGEQRFTTNTNTVSAPATNGTFGLGAGPTWDPAGGDMAELLIYDSALSDNHRQAVERYLSAKYGIAMA